VGRGVVGVGKWPRRRDWESSREDVHNQEKRGKEGERTMGAGTNPPGKGAVKLVV